MKRFVAFLLFLVFVDDFGLPYSARLPAPFEWVHGMLVEPTPLKVRPFDLLMLGCLLVASFKGSGGAYVAPMKNALYLALATTILWFIYGVGTGGDSRAASWQVYLIVSLVLVAFTVAAVFRTPNDFFGLAKWFVAAAGYRGIMCWIAYFTYGHDSVGESGMFLTSHDDTVAWVVSILILIVNMLDRRSTVVVLRNLALILFFIGAIQWNSRRLAWVSLAMGLIVLYALFPYGAAKRKINRVARVMLPLVVVYTVVGWGRQNPLFLPLRSLSSVSTNEDASTLARNAENLGLIATTNGSSFALGTGWGKPYAFLTLKYDISASFELWKYVPHNSILGLLAFTGVLGFAGFWLALPTSVFLSARIARASADPKARSAAIIGAAQVIVCLNQLYGDMGIFSLKPMYTIAVSYAMALRLPVNAGVWNSTNSSRRREPGTSDQGPDGQAHHPVDRHRDVRRSSQARGVAAATRRSSPGPRDRARFHRPLGLDVSSLVPAARPARVILSAPRPLAMLAPFR